MDRLRERPSYSCFAFTVYSWTGQIKQDYRTIHFERMSSLQSCFVSSWTKSSNEENFQHESKRFQGVDCHLVDIIISCLLHTWYIKYLLAWWGEFSNNDNKGIVGREKGDLSTQGLSKRRGPWRRWEGSGAETPQWLIFIQISSRPIYLLGLHGFKWVFSVGAT